MKLQNKARQHWLVGSVLLTTLYLPSVAAEVKLNGFASIRGTSVSSDGGLAPYPNYEEGELSFKTESLFAIQASADLSEGLSATIQLYGDGANDFSVDARWAYISYQLNDTHRVSGGRFANPIFHQSEYEKVGYAHNFSRLPKAVYIGFDFSTIEGIALDSQYNIGDYNLQTKVLYGSWAGESFSAVTNNFVDFGLNKIMSGNATLAGDWWQLFGGVFAAEIDGAVIDSTTVFPLAAGGIAFATANGATAAQVADFKNRLSWDKKDALYWFSGFAVDYSNWLVDFEYVDYGVKDSTDAINTSWYLALGHRFDNVVVTIHTEDYAQKADFDFLNGVTHPVLLATGKGIHNAFAQREFDGVGLSVRYDFHPSAAFKADYFKGTDTRAAVGDYQMFSFGIDLVF
ncbi:MAG: hypothetical protein KKF79_08770 [Gammaproteobacteria bacterium]|jgi:hypothetical protein|nr:hypothetical protein [Gammaproteobacteria bacterium]MBU2224576.1 hypothetical protein [Gammaproteobacteria bacterium]MBU2279186.1 hypothetical protein [Gammaproteobacteria bacterium]MBU2428079.1 hypothetical protein [Gammaproteobacteria bacterium]